MTEVQNPKRPTTHILVICFLCLTIAMNVIILVTGPSGASLRPYYWLLTAYLISGAFALFCLVVGGRHRWGYYVTSGLLGIWSIRSVYMTIKYAWLFASGTSGTGPISATWFHLAERHHQFSLQQLYFLARDLIIVAMVGLMVCLFVRFTFSRESRSYFQFKTRTANDAGDPGKPADQYQ